MLHLLDEGIVHLRLDVHPLQADTGLTGIFQRRDDDVGGGQIEVGVAQDNRRILATEFQRGAD